MVEFMHSVQVTEDCVCNFVLVMTSALGRLYTSNLGDFVKDFYKLRMILISYEIKSYKSKKMLKHIVLDGL